MEDRLSEMSVREFVERLATRAPVPGGGSAAALAGAMGAALVHMVVELTAGRPAAAEHEELLTGLGLEAASAQSDLLRLVEVDAAAYDAVIQARRLPKQTDRERELRQVMIDGATRDATRVPLQAAERAVAVLDLAERLLPIANRHAISDVGVGALLAATAVRGAVQNALINVPSLPADDPLRAEAPVAVERLLDGLGERHDAILSAVRERMG